MEETYDKLMDRLTVIRGFTELLLEGAFGPVTTDQRRILFEVVLEADELNALLHQAALPFTAPDATPRC